MRSILIFGCLLAFPLSGDEPKNVLRPLDAFSRNEAAYRVARDTLVGADDYYWMLVLGEWSTEYSVALKSYKTDVGKKAQSYVEVARADKRVLSVEEKTGEPRQNSGVIISRKQKNISEDDERFLAEASFRALHRVRKPGWHRASEGPGGVLYLFCFDGHSGYARSPESGEAATFVEIWSALGDFVESIEPEKEVAALRRFRTACGKISEN
jgi:hypothetical protein